MEKEDGSDLFQSSCPGNSLNRLINSTTSQSGQSEAAPSDTASPSYLYNSIPDISGYAVVDTPCCGTRSTYHWYRTRSSKYIKVLVTEIMKCTDFWYVTLCGLIEIYPLCIFVLWMWRQHKSPKRRYIATKFHCVTSQKPEAVRFFLFRCSPYSINLLPFGSALALL
jgi:hypothetical protein